MRWDFVNGWKRWSMTWLSWAWTGGIGGGGLWSVRGIAHRGARTGSTGWPSRPQHAYRKLPGLSDWNHRRRTGRTRHGAGQQVRRPTVDPFAGDGLTFDNLYSVLHLEGDETVMTRCLLIATGADYRLLQVEGCAKFEGAGFTMPPRRSGANVCRDGSHRGRWREFGRTGRSVSRRHRFAKFTC